MNVGSTIATPGLREPGSQVANRNSLIHDPSPWRDRGPPYSSMRRDGSWAVSSVFTAQNALKLTPSGAGCNVSFGPLAPDGVFGKDTGWSFWEGQAQG